MRRQAKYILKWVIAQGLYRTGVLHVWLRLWHRNRAIVLTYHRVLPESLLDRTWSHPGIVVTRRTFERQLRLLQRTFHVMSATDFVLHIETGKPFRTPACLITFDDGWQDTFSYAGPLLNRYQLPSLVFLPTDFIGTKATFWQEHLGHLLCVAWQRCRGDVSFREQAAALLPPELRKTLDVDEPTVRGVIRENVNQLKSRSTGDPRQLAERLGALLGVDGGSAVDGFMNWDQVRSMAAERTTFGGHSASHRIMTSLSPTEVDAEVRECRDVLRRETGELPTTFSYPNGNWDDSASRIVRESGFRVSFGTAPGSVSPDDDRFSLRRVNVHEDATSSLPMFMAKIVGVF